jgi:hypothetical protein
MEKKPPFSPIEERLPRRSPGGRHAAFRRLLFKMMERRRAAGLMLPEIRSLLGYTDAEITKHYLSRGSTESEPGTRRQRTKRVPHPRARNK